MAEGHFEGTAFETLGEGPSVVLIHGLGLNRRMWDWQLPGLTPHFRLLRYDLLGHGDSAKPPGPYNLARFVDQLHGLLDHLEIERAGLLGFSLGGMINRAFALAHPARVSALAILNSVHGRTPAEAAAVRARVEQAAAGGPEATVAAALERWFTAEFAARAPQVLDQVRRWVLANDRQVYPALYRVLDEGDAELVEAAAAIRCPTLVITGGEDPGNSPDMARRLAALIPGARAEVLPGLRHMGLAEDPAAFNALLVPFLEGAAAP